MRKTYLHTAIIFFLCLLSLNTFAIQQRLTVVVIVDGLRQDNLDMLRPYWGQGGLRLLSEEAYQTTFTFPHEVYGGNETVATLMTGTCPAQHGYAMDNYYRRSDRLVHDLLEDPLEKGINSSLALSPRALLAPTICDYMRMQAGENAKIYAIGIHPQTAILMAGHSADACVWLQTDKVCWASTTYYTQGLPAAADEMNMNGRLTYLAEQHWTPRLNMTSYMHPTKEELGKAFDYLPSTCLTTSPAANKMVVELALSLQEKQHLGTDAIPDMLLLELTTCSPKATSDRIQSAEQEDMYLALNQDVGFLIEQLHKRLGRTQVDFIVLGRPIYGLGSSTMELAKLPVRDCDADRIAALTSTYLMALYGHERWVDGAYGNTLYLNRKLIEQRKMSLTTMQRQVADFLMEFEGVNTAFPINEALLHPQLMAQINKHIMADVVFSLLPGWQLTSMEHVVDYVIDMQPSAPLLYWSTRVIAMPEHPISATDIISLIQ